MAFKVGDRLRLNRSIYEEGEDVPPGQIASNGDIVFVKRTDIRNGVNWYVVAHAGRDGGFWIGEHEAESEADFSDT